MNKEYKILDRYGIIQAATVREIYFAKAIS